jgi:hypothetical protein
MRQLRIAVLALIGLVSACGGDDSDNPGGGTGGSGGTSATGGTGGTGETGGTGGTSETGGQGGSGGIPDMSCSFTASGVATPEAGEAFAVDLQKSDNVQVIKGHGISAVNFLRFEGLYASDTMLDKNYLGVEYSLLIDILDTEDTYLEPGQYNTLGSKGAVLTIKYEEGMWHTFNLEVDTANGDFVEVEEGTHESSEDTPVPQIKSAYQLSFVSYTDMNATTVPATGSLTGRLDGYFSVHQDSAGTYAE